MSQDNHLRDHHPLGVRPPSPGTRLAQAATWAAGAAAVLTGLLLVWALLQSLLQPGYFTFRFWAFVAEFAAVAFVLFLAGRLLWQPRRLRERVFAFLGFAATFFGLAMLLIFFARLAIDTARWLETTPELVRAENEELRVKQKKVDEAKQFVKDKMKTVLDEMNDTLAQAATPEEKAEIKELYEKEVLPLKRKDFEQMVKDFLVEIPGGTRADPTPLSALGYFLTHGSSSDARPQDAGIYPALIGSLWIALITLLFSVPVGVGAALYLEEYRGTGWFNRVIQVNINNLAGVPSVVYGVLGAFVFIDLVFRPLSHQVPHVDPRNVLGGGLTLGLLALPLIIVASQEAIRAVPRSVREGAYALGSTRWQVIWHLVLPMARPGILTGTILSISRAIGEAAPLVLFGVPMFVSESPGPFSTFTVLPLQIYGWTDRVDVAWRYNAALTCVVLLVMLLGLNALAIYLRSRSQHRMQ